MTTPLAERGDLDIAAPIDADEALRQLYDEHGPILLSYLLRLTNGDRQLAEDLLQDTFIRAWQHPDARGRTGRWSRAWLFTVARNIAIDAIRAARVRPAALGDARIHERADDIDEAQRVVDISGVREGFAALPDLFREVLFTTYVLDRPVAEAAEILGVPQGTVKSRTYYALKALRAELLDRGFGNGAATLRT